MIHTKTQEDGFFSDCKLRKPLPLYEYRGGGDGIESYAAWTSAPSSPPEASKVLHFLETVDRFYNTGTAASIPDEQELVYAVLSHLVHRRPADKSVYNAISWKIYKSLCIMQQCDGVTLVRHRFTNEHTATMLATAEHRVCKFFASVLENVVSDIDIAKAVHEMLGILYRQGYIFLSPLENEQVQRTGPVVHTLSLKEVACLEQFERYAKRNSIPVAPTRRIPAGAHQLHSYDGCIRRLYELLDFHLGLPAYHYISRFMDVFINSVNTAGFMSSSFDAEVCRQVISDMAATIVTFNAQHVDTCADAKDFTTAESIVATLLPLFRL